MEYEIEAFINVAWRDWQTLKTTGSILFFMDRREKRYPNWGWRYRRCASFEQPGTDWEVHHASS